MDLCECVSPSTSPGIRNLCPITSRPGVSPLRTVAQTLERNFCEAIWATSQGWGQKSVTVISLPRMPATLQKPACCTEAEKVKGLWRTWNISRGIQGTGGAKRRPDCPLEISEGRRQTTASQNSKEIRPSVLQHFRWQGWYLGGTLPKRLPGRAREPQLQRDRKILLIGVTPILFKNKKGGK